MIVLSRSEHVASEHGRLHLADKQLVVRVFAHHVDLLQIVVFHERRLRVECELILHRLETGSRELNLGLGDVAAALPRLGVGISLSLRVDNLDSSLGRLNNIVRHLNSHVDLALLTHGKSLLIGNLRLHDGVLVRVGQINLEQHEALDASIGLGERRSQILLHLYADLGSLAPVVGSLVGRCDLEDGVTSDSLEDLLVVLSNETVHLR